MAQYGPVGGDRTGMRWQEWCNLVLAVWLFISPWVLGFAAGGNVVSSAGGVAGTPGGAGGPVSVGLGDAAWNAWVIAVILALVMISAASRIAAWQEWVGVILGIWLFIAPWVLGFSGYQNPAWDHWIVGILVFLVSISGFSMLRRGTAFNYAQAGQKPGEPLNPPRDPLHPTGPLNRPPTDLGRPPEDPLNRP